MRRLPRRTAAVAAAALLALSACGSHSGRPNSSPTGSTPVTPSAQHAPSPVPVDAALRAVRNLLRTGTPARPVNLTVFGDSISFGAGNTNPRYEHDWPGRLRTELTGQYGDAGTGFVPADALVHASPTEDPRWTFTGPNITTSLREGFHQAGVYAIQPGSSLQFTCSAGCTSFVLYTLASPSEAGEVRVDGGAARTVRASHPGLVPLSGYPINHLVWQVPAGPFGRHTLTLTATGPIDLYGIEARTGHGSLRVNNVSISGKSLRTLGAAPGYDDETNHAYGLPMVDAILHAGPTVAVIELGINDWLEGSPTSIVTTRLTKLIARVRADGARPVLYAPPQPIPLVQRHPGAGTYTQLVTAERLLAHSLKVAFLDHQKLYAPSLTDEQAIYEAGHGLGMYGDGIHPSDQGSAAMVDGYGHTPGIRAFLGL